MPVLFFDWESYSWKNELAIHRDRVVLHFQEAVDDAFAGPHNPLHMLERAFVLGAFCIRRMIEKKLITDRLANRTIKVRTFIASDLSAFRHTIHRSTGGNVYENYSFSSPEPLTLTLNALANEIIHSSQLMIVLGEPTIQEGILFASDLNMSNRIIHLTCDEFRDHVQSVLDDRVLATSDSWDPDSGKIKATRE